ncbi:hypothetical protein LINPERPRIM_LOCUS22143 [Linum perenne]
MIYQQGGLPEASNIYIRERWSKNWRSKRIGEEEERVKTVVQREGGHIKCKNRMARKLEVDKAQGLVNVIQQMFPLVEHRCCVRHLYVNFSGKFGRSKHLKDLLWGVARSTHKSEFNSWMALIEKESSKYQQRQATPHDWLVGKNAEQWFIASCLIQGSLRATRLSQTTSETRQMNFMPTRQ